MPISVSNDNNIGWNTLVSGLMPLEQIKELVQVRVRPLDAYIEEEKLPCVDFVKIDAEGYEFPILLGMRRCLARDRPVILCEVVPPAYPLLGHSLRDLRALLEVSRYDVLDTRGRPLQLESLERTTNILLLPE